MAMVHADAEKEISDRDLMVIIHKVRRISVAPPTSDKSPALR
jgi:hypothetical protein